jgi:hypothetical protein
VTVPSNLLVGFPAAWVPFEKVAGNKRSLLGLEVSVIGNFVRVYTSYCTSSTYNHTQVNEVSIAGIISISQFSTGEGAGTVTSVNNDGTLTLEGGLIL